MILKLIENDCMSDKTINYIGMGLGILVTIMIVSLSEESVLTMRSSDTIYYDILDYYDDYLGYYFAWNYTGWFRFLLSCIGFFLSFKFRTTLGGLIGNFHEKM
jgi:hypothetical protein